MNDRLHESSLPKKIELWIFNAKDTSFCHCPLDKLRCQKVQLVGLGDLEAVYKTEVGQSVWMLVGPQVDLQAFSFKRYRRCNKRTNNVLV